MEGKWWGGAEEGRVGRVEGWGRGGKGKEGGQ